MAGQVGGGLLSWEKCPSGRSGTQKVLTVVSVVCQLRVRVALGSSLDGEVSGTQEVLTGYLLVCQKQFRVALGFEF